MNSKRARRVAAHGALHEVKRGAGFRSHKLCTELGVPLDPFLSFERFHMSAPTFAPHPHAGLSAVTYLFERSAGALVSRESSGETRRIVPGAVRWMEAARGMMHEESPEERGKDCHGLQVLVNLAATDKRAAPRVFHREPHEIPEARPGAGARVRVICGDAFGVASSLAPRTPVTLLDVFLAPGVAIAHPVPEEHIAFVLALDGAGEVGPEEEAARLEQGTAAALVGCGSEIAVRAGGEGFHLIVAAGAPLREQVTLEGPFSMTSPEEIADAWARHAAGEMGYLTRIGTPPLGRSVADGSFSTGAEVESSRSTCRRIVASTMGPSMSAKWLPMQVRGPALKGR
jgi:redox-sensitive bicupin YhaK (pirin superfamily)